jgi:hypothetical protein
MRAKQLLSQIHESHVLEDQQQLVDPKQKLSMREPMNHRSKQ